MLVTRRLKFDAGHRIPHHKSQCRHLHGHRYAIEISLSGNVINTPGASEEGMVMDYSDIKAIAQKHVIEQWDHAFLVYAGDTAVADFLKTLEGHKTVVLDCMPTAENLAALAFRILDPAYRDTYGNNLRLEQVRIYETPNNWADAIRDQI